MAMFFWVTFCSSSFFHLSSCATTKQGRVEHKGLGLRVQGFRF